MKDTELLAQLRRQLCDAARTVIPPGPVALLDFPDYANPGDSAIWLGALACLSSLGFQRPAFVSDIRSFDGRALRRAMPDGTILLTGGGNFGDLWPRHQAFRERLLREFPDYPVVQLPQTIHFTSRAALSGARRALDGHARFSLMARDRASLDLARELGWNATLAPDLVFALSPESETALRCAAPNTLQDILWLLRRDHESAGRPLPSASGAAVDWADARIAVLERVIARVRALYPALARRRVRRGCALLRSARTVVTDRLHGHILCLLLGVRHVLIGDRYGKIRAFVETWTSASSLVAWADGPESALAVARPSAPAGVPGR